MVEAVAEPAVREERLGQCHLPEFTFIDLFAGIGGIRIGFENAGGRCVFTSEWDRFAVKTYEANFKDIPKGDITKVQTSDIPDHDVLVGGFPCQPFSIAGVTKHTALGNEHGFKHRTQGTLFFQIARILADKRPRAFLLENVRHLTRHDGGRTFKVIIKTLKEDLGYDVHWKVIDGAVTVPQHRERVYIVGFSAPTEFEFPEEFPRRKSLLEILDPEPPTKYTLTEHLWEYLQNYARKHKAMGNGFGFGLVDAADPDATTRTLSARYYKDGSEILLDQPGNRPRRLTPRECAELMGFPSWFQIPVSDTQAYRQFGNSVVVPVVESVARRMAEHLTGPTSTVRSNGHSVAGN